MDFRPPSHPSQFASAKAKEQQPSGGQDGKAEVARGAGRLGVLFFSFKISMFLGPVRSCGRKAARAGFFSFGGWRFVKKTSGEDWAFRKNEETGRANRSYRLDSPRAFFRVLTGGGGSNSTPPVFWPPAGKEGPTEWKVRMGGLSESASGGYVAAIPGGWWKLAPETVVVVEEGTLTWGAGHGLGNPFGCIFRGGPVFFAREAQRAGGGNVSPM